MAKAKMRRLPIVFRALDLDGVTKPVPTAVCPVRGDLMTVGICGLCQDFRRIVFDEHARPIVCCIAPDDSPRRHADLEVQHVLRVPVVCGAPDTTIADVLPYLDLRRPWDVIPVLDQAAKPLGVATGSELHALIASGLDGRTVLTAVMNSRIARVTPHTKLTDATSARLPGGFRGVVIVSDAGDFLGLVDEGDLDSDLTSA